jgi:branched-subunit amino acid aminotransferase/4-amino-4-deoxychorismate lyase
MAEWRECLVKGGFLRAGAATFDLIETMAFTPDEGIALLELHLERMKASAAELGFARLTATPRATPSRRCASMPMPPRGCG